MSREVQWVSASGLRPLGAFLVLGMVVVAVGLRVGVLAHADSSPAGVKVRKEAHGAPAYDIADRSGVPLARSLRRVDLVLSARSMWQAHTPDHMAERISEALGGAPDPATLLAALLPGAEEGAIRVAAWDLDSTQALRTGEWLLRGSRERGVRGSLPGIEVTPHPRRAGRLRFVWRPAVLLSREVREAYGFTSPVRWTRWLADGLARCLWGDDALPPTADADRLAAQRQEVWGGLFPRDYARVIEGVPGDRVLALSRTLEEEGVHPYQMSIEVERERVYPAGEFELVGDWGYLRPEDTEPAPRSGLERLCDRVLDDEALGWIDREAGAYRFFELRAARHSVRPYYGSVRAESAPVTFRTTLDVDLQREVRGHLEATLAENRAALAMAIAVELETGAILAIDSVAAYPFAGFAPTLFQFTPGSTFKVVTMSCALDEGVVTPDERIDVGYGGAWHIEGSSRTIHEAEGHAEGVITAAECLSESMNAGLVQIGLRVDSRELRRRFQALGYGRAPGLGIGPERSGTIPPLAESGEWEGRWSRAWSHASVCFGHEISTTLVQHAAALTGALRGGVWRPLHLLESVEQEGLVQGLVPETAQRVFRAETARTVRDMMRLGAREGTGRHVQREYIDMGTKTGTAEKVPGEVCSHLLGETYRIARERGLPVGNPDRDLRGQQPDDHRSCYTSSMCIFGRRLDDDREVFVLVVVEEPRAKKKFGSEVAGPAAIAILEEALGVTRGGELPVAAVVPGFAPSSLDGPEARPEAWREEVR